MQMPPKHPKNQPTMEQIVEGLAAEFAKSLMAALRSAQVAEPAPTLPMRAAQKSAPLSETIGVKVRGGGVRQIRKDVLMLTGLLSTTPGLRAKEIRERLHWDKKTTTEAITHALEERRIKKQGETRATTYFNV
jgi:hypothetical protein